MELKITKEKVLDAASKCSTAKATLEVLFPEAFGDKTNMKIAPMHHQKTGILAVNNENDWMVAFKDRTTEGNIIYLRDSYKWEILKDNGFLILKPTK